MTRNDEIAFLVAISEGLGNKGASRRYQTPRERLEEMFAAGTFDDHELRRLQVAKLTGAEGDVLTAESESG